MSFYKRFDEISANLTKLFKTKKTYLEAAAQFDALARTQDENDPFQAALVALAKFGEMQCYQRADDKPKLVQTAVKAARLYLKAAEFSYDISRSLKETWSDPLADGLHCYKVGAECLRGDGKPNLAVVLLLEMGRAQVKFDLFHYAANTFEDALNIALDQKLAAQMVLDTAAQAIDCYVRADRLDLGLGVVGRVVASLAGAPWVDQIGTSTHAKRRLLGLKILRAAMEVMAFRHDEAKQYAARELGDALAKFFNDFVEATRHNEVARLEALIREAKKQNFFFTAELAVLERHVFLLAKSIEAAYHELVAD